MIPLAPCSTLDPKVAEYIATPRTVAVVGLSPDPKRDSNLVAVFLQAKGWKVIPVNPKAEEILGQKAYPDLAAIPEKVDLVDVFRASEHVPPIAAQAVAMGATALWLQEGVVHEQAARDAQAAGLLVVQNRCIKKDIACLPKGSK